MSKIPRHARHLGDWASGHHVKSLASSGLEAVERKLASGVACSVLAADGGGTETLPDGVQENVARAAADKHALPESVAGNSPRLDLAWPLAALGRRESVVVAAAGASLAAAAAVLAAPPPASTLTSAGCSADSDSSYAWPRSPLGAMAAVDGWSSGSAKRE